MDHSETSCFGPVSFGQKKRCLVAADGSKDEAMAVECRKENIWEWGQSVKCCRLRFGLSRGGLQEVCLKYT